VKDTYVIIKILEILKENGTRTSARRPRPRSYKTFTLIFLFVVSFEFLYLNQHLYMCIGFGAALGVDQGPHVRQRLGVEA